MIVVVAFLIVVGCVLIYLWVKFCYWIIPTKKPSINPYIIKHQQKLNNDRNYKAYLKWLERQGGEVPIDKVQTNEEKAAEEKIKNLLK